MDNGRVDFTDEDLELDYKLLKEAIELVLETKGVITLRHLVCLADESIRRVPSEIFDVMLTTLVNEIDAGQDGPWLADEPDSEVL